MKICLIVSMHNRVTELGWFNLNLGQLRQYFEIEVVLVTSDAEAFKLAKSFGYHAYFHETNTPLGAKRNRANKMAREVQADVYVNMADDHLMNREYLAYCCGKIEEGFDLVGALDVYFYDYVKKKALYYPGYTGARRGEPQGICKVYSRNFLERLGWSVTEDGAVANMDAGNMRTITKVPFRAHYFFTKCVPLAMAVDLKNGKGLNNIENFLPDGGEYIDKKVIFNRFEMSID